MPTKRTPRATHSDPLLGAHIWTTGGLLTCFERAVELDVNTFQIFIKSNKQFFARSPISPEDIASFRTMRSEWEAKLKKAGRRVGPIVAHASYLLNLGSSDPEMQERSRLSYQAEIERAETIGIDHLVFHPGSHNKLGEEGAIRNIIDALNDIHADTKGLHTTSCVEITAGQGAAVGYQFEHLERILGGMREPERVTICLDTCHMFAAGYDIRTAEAWEETFEVFEEQIGFEKLVCVHTNDSKKGLGSKVDRHEGIGQGEIGTEAFRLLMNDPRFQDIPKILETPKDEDMTEDFVNLRLLRSLIA